MMCATVPSGQVQIKSLNKGASSVFKVGKEPDFTPPATERQVSQRVGTACSCFPCPAARADQTYLFGSRESGFLLAGVCSLTVPPDVSVSPLEVFNTSILAVLSCPRFVKRAEGGKLPQKRFV